MDRKMEKSMVALGDEELSAVSGATALPYYPSIVVNASPITVAQAVVNTTTQVSGGLGNQSAVSAGANSSNISFG